MSQTLNRKHPAMERGLGFVQMNRASGYRATPMCGRISNWNRQPIAMMGYR
jgi:hypothetical protein